MNTMTCIAMIRRITTWTSIRMTEVTYCLELQTKVREDFTVTEKAPTRAFNNDCEIFANFRLKL